MKKIEPHIQTWIKANVQVDLGVADIVSALNAIYGLRTIESCEGHDEWGFVFFEFGEYDQLCRLVFGVLAPMIRRAFGEEVVLSVFISTSEKPRCELRFRKTATQSVAATLKKIISRRSFEYSCGTCRTGPHNWKGCPGRWPKPR